jgi:hypothetical protein
VELVETAPRPTLLGVPQLVKARMYQELIGLLVAVEVQVRAAPTLVLAD